MNTPSKRGLTRLWVTRIFGNAWSDSPERDLGAPSSAHDWSDLMARAQDGDRDAYRLLLEGLLPYLRRSAARHFQDQIEIEDAVQDVLRALHAVRHTFDPRQPFTPWLAAIANRCIASRVTHTRRHGRLAGKGSSGPNRQN